VNAGQNPQKYPKGDGGFFHLLIGITPANLCNEPYVSAPTDIVPNQVYDGAVNRMDAPMSVVRGASSLWFMGASKPSQLGTSSQIQIQVDDPNKIYDAFMKQNMRNQVIRIRRVASGAAVATAENIFIGVLDLPQQSADQKKIIVANGRLSLLGVQLQRPLFPPDADSQLAGKPYPFREGIIRNCTPLPSDATNLVYPLTDTAIAAFGKIRAGGVEKAYGIDCTITADGRGLQFTSALKDKLQVEFTTFGGSFAPSGTDVLGGAGVFGSATANANGQPTGWTGNGGYGGLAGVTHTWQLQGSAPNKVVTQAQQADGFFWLQNAATLAAGGMYAYEIVVTNAPYFGPGNDGMSPPNPLTIDPAYVGFTAKNDFSGQFYEFCKVAVPAAGTYRGFFTNNFSTAVPTNFYFAPNEMIQGTGGVNSHLDISSVKLVALPAVLQNITLAGPGLDYMLRRLLIDLGPLAPGDYDSTGAAAIDAATAYQYGLSISQDETVTVAAACQRLLNSCGSCFIENRDGRIGVFRLEAPESKTAIGTLTRSNIKDMLKPQPDGAEQLTNRAEGTKNIDPASDADFANQTTATVPIAVRNLLKAAYQSVRASGVGLHSTYAEAISADPLETCLDLASDVQAEITRVNQLFSVRRNFYVATVFSPLGTTFDIGQVYNVTYPTGNLVSGQNLVVLSVDEQPSEELSTLVMWGI
jgi:hypothetical protein